MDRFVWQLHELLHWLCVATPQTAAQAMGLADSHCVSTSACGQLTCSDEKKRQVIGTRNWMLQYSAILATIMTVLQAVSGDAVWYSSGTVCEYHLRCDVVTHSCIAFRACYSLLLLL